MPTSMNGSEPMQNDQACFFSDILRGSSKARTAHADYARYVASAALDNPELQDNRSALANHRNNPLAQRGARWHAVNDELLRD